MRGVQRTLIRAFIEWADSQGLMALDRDLGRQEQIEQITGQFLTDEGRRIWAGK